MTNLGLLLLVVVLGLGWVLYYTESFATIASLLTLGGAATGLAFMSKLLPEDRLKELQNFIATNVLERKRTLIFVLLLSVTAGVFPALFLGTIQVQSTSKEPLDRDLSIQVLGSDRADSRILPPNEARRTVLWTNWWSPKEFRIKVSGYPDRIGKLFPLARWELRVPSSFQRPVVLIRPTAQLAELLFNQPKTLVVMLRRKDRELTVGKNLDYTGQSIWIGCDEDVQVPQTIVDSWVSELSPNKLKLADAWQRPETLGDEHLRLMDGDVVHFALTDSDGRIYSERSVFVRHPKENFVIEGILEFDAVHE